MTLLLGSLYGLIGVAVTAGARRSRVESRDKIVNGSGWGEGAGPLHPRLHCRQTSATLH